MDNTKKTADRLEEQMKKPVARRALIRAGWAVPVAMMIASPRTASAGGSGPHTDHSDGIHVDAHVDL